jgi:uncharacterized protein
MRAVIGTAAICLVLVPSARAASFDCAKASSFVEKAICSDKELSGMDDQLARLYKAARGAASNAALEAEQKAWLSSRDQCPDAACLKKAYADRIAALSGPAAVPSAPGNLTGTYKMKGGEALIQQTAGKIRFSINATYGQNTGKVSGDVPLTGDSAKYVDRDADCTLSFKFAAGKLDVAQDGTCGMGLNVSGSGTYKRVNSAPPKFDD